MGDEYHIPYRILSFDGGGIRGLVSSIILQRICEEHPSLLEDADMIAGTSTGGIIALCIAAGLSPRFVADLYVRDGREIFRKSWKYRFGLSGTKYRNDGLRDLLSTVFGDMRLQDLYKDVVITSVDLRSESLPHRWKPKVWHNREGGDMRARVVDVALYTSAAPTYFPAVDGYVDGGLVANNPCMVALSQAVHDGVDDDLVSVLSIGTGTHPRSTGKNSFGLFDVGLIVDLILDGTKDMPTYMARAMLGERFFRIDPELGTDIAMDDVSAVADMIRIASLVDIGPAIDWLREWL